MSFFYIVFGLVSQMVLVSESSHGLGLLPAHYIRFSFPKAVSRDTTSHLHVFLGICGKQHLLPSCNYLCRVWRTPATSMIAERIKLEVQNWVLMVSISYDCMMYLREESWVLFWANTLMFNQHVNKFLTSWTSSLFCNCLWFSRLGTFPNILCSFPYMYSKLKY